MAHCHHNIHHCRRLCFFYCHRRRQVSNDDTCRILRCCQASHWSDALSPSFSVSFNQSHGSCVFGSLISERCVYVIVILTTTYNNQQTPLCAMMLFLWSTTLLLSEPNSNRSQPERCCRYRLWRAIAIKYSHSYRFQHSDCSMLFRFYIIGVVGVFIKWTR